MRYVNKSQKKLLNKAFTGFNIDNNEKERMAADTLKGSKMLQYMLKAKGGKALNLG